VSHPPPRSHEQLHVAPRRLHRGVDLFDRRRVAEAGERIQRAEMGLHWHLDRVGLGAGMGVGVGGAKRGEGVEV